MAARSKTSGKVVDQWCWVRPDGGKVLIDLRLVKRQDESNILVQGTTREDRNKPPYPTIGTEFYVEMDDPQLYVKGTDCEAIRRTVFSALDKRYAIQWEKYYLVEIRPERPYHGLGSGFCLTYSDIEKGTTFDGKELKREYSYHRREYSYHVEPWPGEFRDREGKVQACIPATPENEKALKEFTRRIEELREAMKKFLSPELIQQTLADLANNFGNLLPPPPSAPKSVKSNLLPGPKKD